MAEREKVSGFRLPQETLDKLDELQDKGIIKNRTDGVIKGIQLFHELEAHKKSGNHFYDVIALVTKEPRFMDDWVRFPVGVQIHFYGEAGTTFRVTKIGPEHAEIVRERDGQRMTIIVKND